MLRLDVDAEGRETAIVSCAKLVDWNVFGGLQNLIANLFWRLDIRTLRAYISLTACGPLLSD